MIRAVLDTNALAAGLARITATSAAVQVLDRWVAGIFVLVISDRILTELSRTLQRKYFQTRLTTSEIDAFLKLLRENAVHIPITHSVSRIAAHPEDDLVLATALSGGASYVVTGDRAFLRVRKYRGVKIVTPRQFLDVLDQAVEPRR